MLQHKIHGQRATPVATSRQQWQHRLDRSKLSNVLAALVVVAGTLSLLLPTMMLPLCNAVVGELRLLVEGWRTEAEADVITARIGSLSGLMVIVAVFALPLALYVRYLAAAIIVHGRRQGRRIAGAWTMGLRSLRSSPLSSPAAMTNLVGALIVVATFLFVFCVIAPAAPLSSMFMLFPVLTAIGSVAGLGGLAVWLTEEVQLVKWVARSICVLFPQARSITPMSWASLRCAICDGRALPRSAFIRTVSDAGRAGKKIARTSHSPLAREIRRLRRFLGRDPLKIVVLAVVILPAALGLSVEEYMMVVAIVATMTLVFKVFVRNIGSMIFFFWNDEGVGSALMAMIGVLGILVNCMVVAWIVDWGAEVVGSWDWRLDENYAALFLLFGEAVTCVVVLALLGFRLPGVPPVRPAEALWKSVLPLASLLLAAVLAPWWATFTAFLIGIDFGKKGDAEGARVADEPALRGLTARG